MQLGVFTFNTEYTIGIDRLAVAAEERGFESLWVRAILRLAAADEPTVLRQLDRYATLLQAVR
jgi:hypothetical protein